MQRCPTSYAVTEIEIKIRYHYLPTRIAEIWNTSNTKCCQGCAAMWTLLLLVGMQNNKTTLEDCLVVSYRTKYTLTKQSINSTY